MPITAIVSESLQRSFGMYQELGAVVDEVSLGAKLPHLPSNTIGEQLWCVVGARESYARAIAEGEWDGFSCSLTAPQTRDRESVAAALADSAEAVGRILLTIEGYSDVQHRLLIDLLEHEAAHHGQLIRYLYGLNLAIPESWKARYALKDGRAR